MTQITQNITYLNRDIDVEFDYSPGEPEVWTYSNGDPGHPGEPEEIWIHKVWYKNRDITAWLKTDDFIAIEEILFNTENDDDPRI